ncbi:MAG: hypothetical protein LBV63_00730 [Candidatus Methanoplasma sp.]|jgi:hypothetical protein|nr:hypothetical protein [Candidatus Methanoplasma sp.]
MTEMYKVCVSIPPEFADKLMDSVTKVADPVYPGYERAFSVTRITGTWRTLEGSSPYNGKIGDVTEADELKIEFAVKEKDLKATVSEIVRIHPYEEPGIDIIPMIGWKSILE